MSNKIISLESRRGPAPTPEILIAGRLRRATQFAALARDDVEMVLQALAAGHTLPNGASGELAGAAKQLASATASLEILRQQFAGEEGGKPR